MGMFSITPNDLNILYAQQGSLILTYWFTVAVNFVTNGDITTAVFDSGI